ncbi:MAG: PhzF family phenazine biosynthesis protein [Lachnospiraceae bacterium]|nr:PhzF family phenazine biosynthesis protein [Lachnospiraceae bacterium]
MKFYIVDVFAEGKYQGNELLVVIPDRPLGDREQEQIAREINFSETAFILSGRQADGGYDVRIWMPRGGEVPFAGHPTLGTAFIIHRFLEGGQGDCVLLNLKAGQIPVEIRGNTLCMRQNPPVFGEMVAREEIAEIYGIAPDDIRADLPVQWVSTGLEAVLIPLKSREVLSRLVCSREKFQAYLRRHPENECSHLFFTETAPGVFAARNLMEDYFEDPATGSANGDLACYMLEHDYFGSQDIRYTVYQGEDMGRPSRLDIRAARDGDRWTVEVGGGCYLVAEGDWK